MSDDWQEKYVSMDVEKIKESRDEFPYGIGTLELMMFDYESKKAIASNLDKINDILLGREIDGE